MAYTAVSWAYQEVVSSTKLNAMAANDADANTRLGYIGAVQSAQDTTAQNGAVSSVVIYATATLTLPAGTWLVQGGAGVINLTTGDYGAVGLYNVTAAAVVANSISAEATIGTTAQVAFTTRPVVLVLAASTQLRVYAKPNGASALRFFANTTGPVAWLNAVRLA